MPRAAPAAPGPDGPRGHRRPPSPPRRRLFARPSASSASRRSTPTTGSSGEVDDIRGLAREFGSLGLLGMHLEGYGCAGMSATEYGLACVELEASDSGCARWCR